MKCQLMAKSGHPWLAERFKEDLVVKCQFLGARVFLFFGLRSFFHFRFVSRGFENFPGSDFIFFGLRSFFHFRFVSRGFENFPGSDFIFFGLRSFFHFRFVSRGFENFPVLISFFLD